MYTLVDHKAILCAMEFESTDTFVRGIRIHAASLKIILIIKTLFQEATRLTIFHESFK